jgi:hypothetical protein
MDGHSVQDSGQMVADVGQMVWAFQHCVLLKGQAVTAPALQIVGKAGQVVRLNAQAVGLAGQTVLASVQMVGSLGQTVTAAIGQNVAGAIPQVVTFLGQVVTALGQTVTPPGKMVGLYFVSDATTRKWVSLSGTTGAETNITPEVAEVGIFVNGVATIHGGLLLLPRSSTYSG